MDITIKKGESPKREIPQLGTPRKVKGREKSYYIKERVQGGRIYTLRCPDCGFVVAKKVQDTNLLYKHVCPKCKTVVAYGVYKTTGTVAAKKTGNIASKEKPAGKNAEAGKREEEHPVTHPFNAENMVSGEIEWGGLFAKKHLRIGIDAITVGRRDNDEPSIISLDDEYASRRSVIVEPVKTDKGFLYKMTVLRAANPVFVNGREVMVGNSIYLNYGDNIKVGKTVLTFKKSGK